MLESLSLLVLSCALLSVFRRFSPGLRTAIYFVTFMGLWLHDGLRWNIGVDWGSYKDFFDDLDTSYSGLGSSRFEYGYVFLVSFAKSYLFNNYTVFLLLVSLLTYAPLLFSLHRLTNASLLALLPVPAYFAWYAGSQRQSIAISLIFFSLFLCIDGTRRLRRLGILLFIASCSIHYSAVFLAPIYILAFCPARTLASFDIARIKRLPAINRSWLALIASILFLITIAFAYKNIIYVAVVLIGLKTQSWQEYHLLNTDISLSIFGLPRAIISFLFYTYLFTRLPNQALSRREQLLRLTAFSPLISLLLYVLSIQYPSLGLNSRFDLYFGFGLLAVFFGYLSNRLPQRLLLLLVLYCGAQYCITYFRFSCLDLYHPYSFFFSEPRANYGCSF